jgi:archaellum biogenesis protein FlaJ (TadC family)
VSIGAAMGTGLRRLPALLGWGIVAGLAALLGFVLCILPGIYVTAVVSILTAVVVAERGVGVGRCFQLFNADFGSSVARIGTIAALGLGFGIVSSIVSAIATAIVGGGGGLSAQSHESVLSIIVGAVVSGLFSIVSATVFPPLLLTAYADMRARTEPFSTAYLIPGGVPASPNPNPTW